jgi:hypothetical protein
MTAVWLAVASHVLLDLPIHPKDLALYPTSSIHLGWGLWSLGPAIYWWIQLAALAVFAGIYVHGSRKTLPANLIAATCVTLLSLHLMMKPSGI